MAQKQKEKYLKLDDVDYDMNHKNRGTVYFINDYFDNEQFKANIKDFKKSLLHLGFWPFKISKKTKQENQHLNYIENEVQTTAYKNDDCVAIVVLSTLQSSNNAESRIQDLDVMYNFYSDKNEGLECKPRLYFFLYEATKTDKNNKTDSENVYALPVMADQLVIHMIVDELPKALKEISEVMLKINTETYYMNDLPHLVEQVHHNSMTITSTLTRRFLLKQKEIRNEDNNAIILKSNNKKLLFLIRRISEIYREEYITYYENNRLDEIDNKIMDDDMVQIPNRDKLIEELNVLVFSIEN